ncbi:hypothetical protein P5V15_008686 [Pogonomyrmex californicus]
MYIAGDQLKYDTRTADTKSWLDSAIKKYGNIVTRSSSPIYKKFRNWQIESERERYWAASWLLPTESISIIIVAVLLMVLFKRCPRTVATIVTAVIGLTIILITILSLDQEPVYT